MYHLVFKGVLLIVTFSHSQIKNPTYCHTSYNNTNNDYNKKQGRTQNTIIQRDKLHITNCKTI